MNINSIRYFVAAAKEENVTKAARECFISQQALSKEISNLEKELGVSLFVRSANHIRLSQDGRDLLPIATAMLESFDFYSHTMISTAQKSKDALRVLFENDVMMSYIPYDMLGRIGDIHVKTSISKNSAQCIQDVVDMKTDLAMLNRPPKELTERLRFVRLTTNPAYILVSKDHHLATRDYISIDELRREPMIRYEINTYFADEFFSACYEAGFYPNIKVTWALFSTVMAAVVAGEGYTIGGNFVSAPLEDKIIRVPIQHPKLQHVVGFLINPNNPRYKEAESYIRAVQSL